MTATDAAANRRIEHLGTAECWRLLESSSLGRLAVEGPAGVPDVFPVNFTVHSGSVYVRSAPGSKLMDIAARPGVAFEIDGESDAEAWSVVVKGSAVEIERMYELFDAVELPLYPWHAAPKHRYVRIVPEFVSGRRFRVADRAAAHAGEPLPRHIAPE